MGKRFIQDNDVPSNSDDKPSADIILSKKLFWWVYFWEILFLEGLIIRVRFVNEIWGGLFSGGVVELITGILR